MDLPYSVKRGEKLAIQIIANNYLETDQEVSHFAFSDFAFRISRAAFFVRLLPRCQGPISRADGKIAGPEPERRDA